VNGNNNNKSKNNNGSSAAGLLAVEVDNVTSSRDVTQATPTRSKSFVICRYSRLQRQRDTHWQC